MAIASLIVPSIIASLGIALEFRLLDDVVKALGCVARGELRTTAWACSPPASART